MSSCGNCPHHAVASPKPATLFQIREGYRTRWNDLTFLVETDSNQWTLRVQDSQQRKTIYTAHRGGVRAAQVAAADFAIFRVFGTESRLSPDQLATDLNWQSYLVA